MSQIFSEVEDPFLPQAPTKWPTILGWIMLIWGVLGIIQAIWGFANKSLAVETYQGLPDWMVAAFRMIVICGTAVTILGALSGWYLRKKRLRGYSMAKWWVVLCLVLNVGPANAQGTLVRASGLRRTAGHCSAACHWSISIGIKAKS